MKNFESTKSQKPRTPKMLKTGSIGYDDDALLDLLELDHDFMKRLVIVRLKVEKPSKNASCFGVSQFSQESGTYQPNWMHFLV